ncbi:MAG: ATP-binding protein [Pyrinomonadaceae bacterium]
MAAKVGGTLFLAFLASIVLLAIIGVVSYRAVNTLIANNERVTHTQEVLEGLEEIRTLLLQVETDARGFLLTGVDVYKEAYEKDLLEIPRNITLLKDKTRDNASHQARFTVLEEAVRSRLDLLKEYVSRREVLGATVIPPGQGPEGKNRMDAVKSALDAIENAERELLQQRLAQSGQSSQQLLVTLGVSFVGSLCLICLVFYLALRDIRARQLNEANLSAARDQLEDRVRERTAELSILNVELERSNRELQDFAFVASHDLQEPLRKIQAFGDRLRTVQGPKFDEQGKDYLDRMSNAADRMHTLINDLLSYSRVTTKALPFEPTDLDKVVSGVLGDLETRIELSGGKVAVGNLPTIDADAVQMRQLFQNLIANALKFAKEGVSPSVQVSGEVFQGEVASIGRSMPERLLRVSVSDNGIGFDEKYLDRIFTPFQRLHGRNEYEGTGIGLAVCRKIVERHGGSLTAESTPGVGSTFIATLPIVQKENQ